MSYVMRASELVKKHIEVAKNYKTVYMWGCFGSPVTDGIITEKAKQYPDWYAAAKQARFRGLIGKGYFGFDCVNLTKGILWERQQKRLPRRRPLRRKRRPGCLRRRYDCQVQGRVYDRLGQARPRRRPVDARTLGHVYRRRPRGRVYPDLG